MWIFGAVSARVNLVRFALLSATSALGLAVATGSSLAACDVSAPVSGQTVTCSGTGAFSGVVAATGSTAVTINVTGDAALTTSAASALVVQDSSSITNAGSLAVSGGSGGGRAALSALGNSNILTNTGTIVTTSGSTIGISAGSTTSSGGASNNQIINSGSITTSGSTSHGIRVVGPGNQVTNTGTITTTGTDAKGVYMQGGSGVANVLINSGVIHAKGSGTADGAHANTTGTGFYSRIENLAGGQIISDHSYGVRGQNGNDTVINAGYIEGHGGTAGDTAIYMGSLGIGTLILQTGSVINGAADGGAKNSQVFLEGTGVVDNDFRNFRKLTMRGTAWDWTTDATFADGTDLQSGIFKLTSTLTSPTTIETSATLAGTGTVIGNVTSQGTIKPGPGAGNGFGALTIVGNYTGTGAQLSVNTQLGGDSSASDKLVISGGTATGTTGITVTNIGGAGAATVQDGIMVVDAINGATTANGAFALNNFVAAGAYEYYLFKGGISDGTSENWYLRNTLIAPAPTPTDPNPTTPIPAAAPNPEEPAPPPVEPTPENPNPVPTPPTTPAPIPVPTPADATLPPPVQPPPPTPGATPVQGSEILLYRIEVPVYSALPPVAGHLAMTTLGTFHERRGEQSLLSDTELSPVWGRIFGQDARMAWSGTVSPSFDGTLFGFQAGFDAFGRETASGGIDRAGLFVAYANMKGDVRGQALGWNNLSVGSLDVSGTSIGGYWTRIGQGGWYVDGVLMATFFGGNATSSRDIGIDIGGTGVTASLEGGYPIALAQGWTLEPQAQLVWQHLSLDDTKDRFSSVSFGADDHVTGRLGARLQGETVVDGMALQPYLKANIWRDFGGTDRVSFDTTDISTGGKSTSFEFGGGVIAKVTDKVSIFATGDYTTDLGGDKRRILEGNLGFSLKW